MILDQEKIARIKKILKFKSRFFYVMDKKS